MIRSAYVAHHSGWMFLTGGSLCLGVAIADESPLLAELWELVAASADAPVVLDALTRGGISSAPDFAIVTLGANGKVLVRGAATVVVDGSETLSITGVGFSSWAERTFARIDGFSCGIVPAPDAVHLPLANGAVRAGWFGAAAAGVPVFAQPTSLVDPTPLVELVETPPVETPLVETPLVELVETPLVETPHAETPPTPTVVSALSEATVAAVEEPEEEDEVVEPVSTSSTSGGVEPVLTSSTSGGVEPVSTSSTSEVVEGVSTGSTSGYDFLFGDTSYRTVEEAAVRPAADSDGEPDVSSPTPGIEDRTVVASDLAQLRVKRRASRGRAVEQAAPVASFYLELSTGGQELLDQPLVIGRAPSAAALGGGVIPRLVTMTTPNQDISRTHARISVEGGTVIVTDLHSSNGTIVILPGRAAQKLREGETAPVMPGTIIDLGDGATLTVRES